MIAASVACLITIALIATKAFPLADWTITGLHRLAMLTKAIADAADAALANYRYMRSQHRPVSAEVGR